MAETTPEAQAPRDVGIGADGWPFRATLLPNRSLSESGFMVMMVLFGLASFVSGLVFASIGAWPVLGFFGLDVLIVYIAFKLNYRAGRLYEALEVWPERMTLTRVHPSGRREAYEFQTYWVRVLLQLQPDGRTDLRLASHGREVAIGRFMTDDERGSFAQVLQGVLASARAPMVSA
jgi:uncharacterized membrane protein